MVEGHLTLGAGAWMEAGGSENTHGSSEYALYQGTQPARAYQMPAPLPYLAPFTSDSYEFGVPEPETYERASGTTQAVDAIALALSRQHIDSHTETLLPVAQANHADATPAMVSHPVVDAYLPVDCEQTTFLSSSPPLAATLHQTWDRHRSPPPARTGNGQLGRRRHTNSLSVTQEMLLENMICSGIQCNIKASTLQDSGSTGGTPNRLGGEAMLEIDTSMTGDIDFEAPNVKKFLNARRAKTSAGIIKNGLLEYRSSTETAMRCNNLVKSVPRMRKRTKLRRKEALLDILPGAGPAAASTPTAS